MFTFETANISRWGRVSGKVRVRRREWRMEGNRCRPPGEIRWWWSWWSRYDILIIVTIPTQDNVDASHWDDGFVQQVAAEEIFGAGLGSSHWGESSRSGIDWCSCLWGDLSQYCDIPIFDDISMPRTMTALTLAERAMLEDFPPLQQGFVIFFARNSSSSPSWPSSW